MPKSVGVDATKISGLGTVESIGEKDIVPLNALSATGTPMTKSVRVDTLRQTLSFEDAFNTVAEALANTSDKEPFFVYESNAKFWVLQYVNLAGVATPVTGYNNKQVRLPTQRKSATSAGVTDEGGAKLVPLSSIPLNVEDASKSLLGINDLTKLRAFEPTYPGQIVNLVSVGIDWTTKAASNPVGGGLFYFDNLDTTTADDGFLVIVTAGGSRWKRYGSDKNIYLEWAGLQEGDDIAVFWQKAIDFSAAIAVAKGNIYQNPIIHLPGGRYIVSKTVISPPFVHSTTNGRVYLDCSAMRDVNDCAFWIKGYQTTMAFQGHSGLTLSSKEGGSIYFHGPGRTAVTSLAAIRIGNNATERSGSGYSPATCKISGISIRLFNTGLQFTANDAYLITVNKVDIGNSTKAFETTGKFGTTAWNAGERCCFSECTFYGGGEISLVHLEVSGFSIDFDNVSFDYSVKHMFNFAATATWNSIKVINGHLEAFGGYIVNSEAAVAQSYIAFINTDMLATLATGAQRGTDAMGNLINNSMSRKLFNHPGLVIHLDNAGAYGVTQPAYDYDIFQSTAGSGSLTFGSLRNVGGYLRPALASQLMSIDYNFSKETTGTTVSSGTALTNYTARLVGGGSAKVADVTATGGKGILCTPNNSSSNMYINIQTKDYLPFAQMTRLGAALTIQYGNANTTLPTGSQLNCSMIAIWYDKDLVEISRDTFTYDFYPSISDANPPDPSVLTTRVIPSLPLNRQSPPRTMYVKVEWGVGRINSPMTLCHAYVWQASDVR